MTIQNRNQIIDLIFTNKGKVTVIAIEARQILKLLDLGDYEVDWKKKEIYVESLDAIIKWK